MARFLSSLALVVAFLVVSQPSAAGTITSVYSLDPGGILTFEAIGEDFTITGGTVKVAYSAKGPQTPALGSPSGFLLSATLSFSGTESGKIVLLPSSGPFPLSDVSGVWDSSPCLPAAGNYPAPSEATTSRAPSQISPSTRVFQHFRRWEV